MSSYAPTTGYWAGEAEFETRGAGSSWWPALALVIPDAPDPRPFLPIEFRLDAKALVGKFAADLQSGKLSHELIEGAHGGVVAAEIFTDFDLLLGGLGLVGGSLVAGAAPLAGFVAVMMSLGMGYSGAAKNIAADYAARGFSRGALMGADRRSPRDVQEVFGREQIPPRPQFEAGRQTAIVNYRAGLAVGYGNGGRLTDNQRRIFWRDLGYRHDGPRYPDRGASPHQLGLWYSEYAGAFRRFHLTA